MLKVWNKTRKWLLFTNLQTLHFERIIAKVFQNSKQLIGKLHFFEQSCGKNIGLSAGYPNFGTDDYCFFLARFPKSKPGLCFLSHKI
jgi:hypothetical protein